MRPRILCSICFSYISTVAINTLLTNTLGSKAVCWVSSIIGLLKYKKNILNKVCADAFIQLPTGELKAFIFSEFLKEKEYAVHSQLFDFVQLIEGQHLIDLIGPLNKYIEKHIFNNEQKEIQE